MLLLLPHRETPFLMLPGFFYAALQEQHHRCSVFCSVYELCAVYLSPFERTKSEPKPCSIVCPSRLALQSRHRKIIALAGRCRLNKSVRASSAQNTGGGLSRIVECCTPPGFGGTGTVSGNRVRRVQVDCTARTSSLQAGGLKNVTVRKCFCSSFALDTKKVKK